MIIACCIVAYLLVGVAFALLIPDIDRESDALCICVIWPLLILFLLGTLLVFLNKKIHNRKENK